MAEFLKNDPLALRYCLLYEFLQGKTIDDSFTDFCATVGEDFFSKEEISSRFRQFSRGIFQDVLKPVTDIRNILCNRKKALRVCVMYEWLSSKKTTVPANYEHFCKVVGEFSMMYRDFHFWFHRFVDGDFDLNYVNKDEKIYKLTDMPLDIMRNIVEYLNIVDRLSLERTSQSLRLFSQDQQLFHDKLRFHADSDSSYINFGVWDEFKYKNEENDCVIKYRGRVKVLRGVSSLKQAFQDFKKILENRKLYLHTLTVSCSYWSMDIYSLERHIEDALKFTHLLHVQHLSIFTNSMKTLLNILPSLKPGYLTTITIHIELDEATIGELVTIDQWKQAKYLYMHSYLFVGPLRHLYHFHEFRVFRRELFIDDFLLKSSDFEKCALYVQDFVNPIIIMQEFGRANEGSIDTCHYPIPNSTDYFEVLVRYSIIKVERKKK